MWSEPLVDQHASCSIAWNLDGYAVSVFVMELFVNFSLPNILFLKPIIEWSLFSCYHKKWREVKLEKVFFRNSLPHFPSSAIHEVAWNGFTKRFYQTVFLASLRWRNWAVGLKAKLATCMNSNDFQIASLERTLLVIKERDQIASDF